MLIIVTNNQCGHLDAVARPARRAAHRRPRQGLRHADRDDRRQRSRGELRTRAARRRWTTCAPSASRSCSRRWSRACTATRRRRGANFVKDEVDCLERFEQTARGAQAPHPRADGRACARRYTQELLEAPQAGARGAAARARVDLGLRLRGQELRRRGELTWRRWSKPSAWRSTTARSTSASPTSSARTSGRRSAASSPPRRASRPRGTRRSTSAASSARPWASRSPAAARSPRSSSATTPSTPSTCSRSPATRAGRPAATGTCRWW